MKRILFDVSRWHLLLHREHRQLPRATPNDSPRLCLEDELFERLHAGEGERLRPKKISRKLRPWAEQFHDSCSNVPSFNRLAAQCLGDAAAAAAAVETILKEVQLPPTNQPPPPAPPGSSQDPLRRPLDTACARAAQAVDALREALDGLAQVKFSQTGDPNAATIVVLQGDQPGTATATPGHEEQPEVRPLATQLKDNKELAEIARLAGRFKRIGGAKRRQRTKHGADEIIDIELGGELARALPSELAKMNHPLLRLDFLRSLLERQLLQYELAGNEVLGRGPIVVLLDKSGSMEGARNIWASALALALLDHAHRDHRMFALLGFDNAVKYEALVKPGEQLPSEGLFIDCGGGTEIAAAVSRGLEIIRNHPGALNKADLVLITDGRDTADNAPELRKEAARLGVSIFGLGIDVAVERLAPWCDHAHVITDLTTVPEEVATPLFAA